MSTPIKIKDDVSPFLHVSYLERPVQEKLDREDKGLLTKREKTSQETQTSLVQERIINVLTQGGKRKVGTEMRRRVPRIVYTHTCGVRIQVCVCVDD